MADTTTTLNTGAGGDSMDESLVTQSDGVTQAKRPRVVLGTDAGQLIGNDVPLPVSASALLREARLSNGYLRLIAAKLMEATPKEADEMARAYMMKGEG